MLVSKEMRIYCGSDFVDSITVVVEQQIAHQQKLKKACGWRAKNCWKGGSAIEPEAGDILSIDRIQEQAYAGSVLCCWAGSN